MDRIDEWRVFVTVATHLSFTRAARALGRSPQAITRAVAALEGRVGTRLLNRTTRAVSLSSDGERYLVRSRRALLELDALEAKPDATAALSGTIAVTAPVLFGQLHVMPVVDEALRANPQLDARVSLLDRVVSLAEEGFDLGVRIGGLPDSSLRAVRVGSVRAVVCASPAYLRRRGVPRSPGDLPAHDCIAFAGTTPNADRWTFPRAGGRDRSVAVRARLVVNVGQAAIDAALAGLGLVRVLSYQVDRLVREKKLRVVLADHEGAPVPVHVVHLPGVQARAASAFVELASMRLRARLLTRGS
jgi:DNA-binding transcriptional LysR family regulator